MTDLSPPTEQEADNEVIVGPRPEWAELAASNIQRIQNLHAQGVNVNMLGHLVTLLIDVVLPPGTEDRAEFDLIFERGVAQQLDGIESQFRQMILTEPAPAPPMNRAERRRLERGR